MDDPMSIIKRHHEPVMNDHILLHALSEVSAVIGRGFSMSIDDVFSWVVDEEDEDTDLLAQLSHHGLFLMDSHCMRHERYKIAGLCYLHGVPLFTEDDLAELLEKELPPEQSIN